MARKYLTSMARKYLTSRIALAVALSTGLAVAAVPSAAFAAKKEKAAKPDYSEGFMKVAAPIQTAIAEGTKDLPAQAADADLAAAKGKIDAALGGDGKAKLAEAEPLASTQDDKFALGQLQRNYGIISKDGALKLKGTRLMIESGKLPAEEVGKMNFDAGVSAYQLQDYAGAAKLFEAAKTAGYRDPGNMIDAVLADSYKKSGNTSAALEVTKRDIAAAEAQGTKPAETSLRSALQAAYDAKDLAAATKYAAMLGRYYPGKQSWSDAVMVVGRLGNYNGKDFIDVGRFMAAADAFGSENDYALYVDTLNTAGFGAEALRAIEKGKASGAFGTSQANAERERVAKARVQKDKAEGLIAGYQRDADKPAASARTLLNAGETMLSYDMNAQAETYLERAAAATQGAENANATFHLGISQVKQGKYSEAQTNFEKVTGTLQPLATLWSAYAQSRASAATGG
jgi:hypothetical protein